MKLNLAIDAAKRAAAKEIIPILPFPYARQDKRPVWPIESKVIVEMIENRGATGVITYDLHADQIQGF
jgi:ribose-phosphate pyrophosphokinase